MHSAFLSYWPISAALSWRVGFDPDVKTDDAFLELRDLCLAGLVPAIGMRTTDHPRGAKPFRDGYNLFLSPALPPPALIEDIPAEEWADVFVGVDGNLCSNSLRLPCWVRVELPKEMLVPAWLPIIEKRRDERGAGARGRKQGTGAIDDAAVLAAVAEIIERDTTLSVNAAMNRALATVGVVGNSQDSALRRLRRKYKKSRE